MRCLKHYILCLLTSVIGMHSVSKACTNPVLSTSVTNVPCYNGSTGAIALTVTGGNSPFTYSWTSTAGYTSASQNISGLIAGTYSVTVSGGGCSSSATVMVSQPSALASSVTASLACTGSTFNIADGVVGGTSPYTYTWTGPGGFSSNSQSNTVSNVSYANAGTYSVNVTDANGCTKVASTSVSVYATPTLSLYATYMSCSGVDDGSVSLSVSGGTTYTYAWTGPGPFSSNGQNIASLGAGTYTVRVTTNTGCSATGSATVLEPLAMTIGAVSNSPVCTGDVLELFGFGSGGTGALSYSWTGPGSFASTAASPIFTPATVAESGTYTLTVKDANNCTRISSTTVQVSNGPTVTPTVTNANCNGANTGAISLVVTGNSGPYTCAWTGSNGYSASSQNISGLAAGNYYADISITGGCVKHIIATVSQPATIQLLASSNLPVCNGSTLSLAGLANGGSGNLSYSWTGPNAFTSQVSHPTIPSIGFNGSGIYTMTVKDTANCTATYDLSVVVDTVPTLSTTAISVGCHTSDTGAVQLRVSGAPPFTYAWTGPAGYTANTQNITNLGGGTYSVVVTGNGGCTATTSAVVNMPPDISANIFTDTPLCAGGILHLDVAASGGTGMLAFNWAGPNSFSAAQQNTTVYFVTTQDSGIYTLTIKDANNCIKVVNVPVTIVPAPVVTVTATGASCYGMRDGSVALNISGGISPFNFQWTGTGTFSASTQNIIGLDTGMYHVTITGGCQATYLDSVAVSQPAKLNASVSMPNVCAGDSLRLAATASGGTAPYTYSWAGPAGFTAATDTVVQGGVSLGNTGTYTLSIHDAHHCAFYDTAIVAVHAVPLVHVGDDTTVCAGNSVVYNAGNPGDKYLWSNGDTTRSISVTLPNSYVVAVKDNNGCTGYDTVILHVDSMPRIVAIQAVPNGSTFSFTGTEPHFISHYYWDLGDGNSTTADSPVHNYTAKGIYTVRLAGSNTCGSDTIMTTVQVDTLTGVVSIAGVSDDVKMYPDPANDHMTISAQHAKMTGMHMMNMQGVIVYQDRVAAPGTYRINTSLLASGIYIIYVDTDAGTVVRKVSVLR